MTELVRDKTEVAQQKLLSALAAKGPLAIAVSGGVDSMTLAYIAHRREPDAVTMVHAVSPAVPAEATWRVRAYAKRFGWRLVVADAGEFNDPRYRSNPLNRCYFCKTNLYDRIRTIGPMTIATGTNLDDLDDFRPGLQAAAERNIFHPYVEAGISKAMVRGLARLNGLHDLSELPAQPCLASRVETGIAIDADDLVFIEAVERSLLPLLPRGANLRCRIVRGGVCLELDAENMDLRETAAGVVERACSRTGRAFVGVRPYRRGAAFVAQVQ